MIDGKEFIEKVKLYYSFLEKEFDFSIVNQTINGNVFYDLEYKAKEKVISISYENMENYLKVIIFILENGNMPNYDDTTKALHLQELNGLVLSKIDRKEIDLNNKYFAKYVTNSEFEYKLLKESKELRICLKYLQSDCLKF